MILDPVPETEICVLVVNQKGQIPLAVSDVLFGDVWVCSGQSNMEWPMSKIFNATEEISAMAVFDKIRYKPYFIVSFDNFSSKLLICEMKFFDYFLESRPVLSMMRVNCDILLKNGKLIKIWVKC